MTNPTDSQGLEGEDELDLIAMQFIGYAWGGFEQKNPRIVADEFKRLYREAKEQARQEVRNSLLNELEDEANVGKVFTANLTGSAMASGYALAMEDMRAIIQSKRTDKPPKEK